MATCINSMVIMPYMEAVYNLWACGEIVRNPDFFPENIRKSIADVPAGMLSHNETCSWVWGNLFKAIKEKYPESAVVYFIENYDGSRLKIGRTKTLWRRYEEISCTSGRGARVVYAIPTKDVISSQYLERMCQANFPGRNISGEWFVAKDAEGSFMADFIHGLYREYTQEED